MSIFVMTKVWEDYPGGGSELLALLALADWSDDKGRCWPSIASIAKKTRLGEKQARRVIHAIIEAGYLEVTDNAQGGTSSRRYKIRVDRLTPPDEGRALIEGRAPASVPNPSHPGEGTPPAEGSRTVIEPSLTVNKVDAPFDQFWKAYPKKIGKGAAEKAWKKAKLNKSDFKLVMNALEEQKQSDQWRKDHGQYIPNPVTWINQCRWKDELAGSTKAGEPNDYI